MILNIDLGILFESKNLRLKDDKLTSEGFYITTP
jgi:hypothetical protein